MIAVANGSAVASEMVTFDRMPAAGSKSAHLAACDLCGHEMGCALVMAFRIGARCLGVLEAIAAENGATAELEGLLVRSPSARALSGRGRSASPTSRRATTDAKRGQLRALACRRCDARYWAPAMGRAPSECDGCTPTQLLRRRHRQRERLGVVLPGEPPTEAEVRAFRERGITRPATAHGPTQHARAAGGTQ